MSQSALVVATFSRRMRLQLENGEFIDARIKGKRLRPVCGDHVEAEPIRGEKDWLILRVIDRRNELTRPNLRGRIEVLAANLDLLAVVASVKPEPDWFVVDRYLCAAESMRVPAAVVFNKVDLLGADEHADPALDDYDRLGYAVVRTSAESGDGIDDLHRLFDGRIGIIVGQSGVGKSSLINRLVGDVPQRTAALSSKTGEGRHTTVNSVLLQLPDGGAVIDSPGVRDYAPALGSKADVEFGFREIHEAGRRCRFNDCRHLREPDCAVQDGVHEASISARRYESYKRMLRLTESLSGRPP